MSESTIRAIPKINGFSLQRPRLFPVLCFIAVLLVVALFFVWSRLQVIHLEYGISSLESRIREAQQQTRELRLEAASLRNPARIEQVAMRSLGLRYPVPEQVITVK